MIMPQGNTATCVGMSAALNALSKTNSCTENEQENHLENAYDHNDIRGKEQPK
jgi:hypothetical protein